MHILRSSIVLVLSVFVSYNAYADAHRLRLRPVDALARLMIEVGRDRSDLFRTLAGTIEDSDLIVYVATAESLPRSMDGRLQFAAAVEGARYLRITVRRHLAPERLVALLGHELMHAVEIARNTDVRDQASLRALYMRIGHSHDGIAFDTREAVAAGVHVLTELRRARSEAARATQ